MKTDIDKLHNLFLNEDKLSGRREGHTTLFVWQLIGIAELNCYSWYKIQQPVWIPFNKPLCQVFDILKTVGRICKENAIDFAKNSSHQFVIYNTLFEFYIVGEIPFDRPVAAPGGTNCNYYFSSREDNDAMYREWEMNESTFERAMEDTFKSTLVTNFQTFSW